MSIFRIEKTKNYTVMSNYHLKEKEMSLKAKGLLSLMLNLPENWDYSISGLVAICKENETAVKTTLAELKEFGYLRVDKFMPNESKTGRIEYVYNIFEKPQKQDLEAQSIEKQGVENLCLENQLQLNTNNQLTKKLNKKEERKKESATSYDEIISTFDFDSKVITTIYEFIKMRKLIKKPMTDYAFKRMLTKLTLIAQTPETQMQVLENSIINNWQDIYELKECKNKIKQQRADYDSSSYEL